MTTPIFRRLAALLSVSFLFLCRPVNCQAAVGGSGFTEVWRGPNSRVMQRTVSFTNLAGTVITNRESYVEIASGLSVLSNSVWMPASPQIQITGTGGQSTNCQHCVWFTADCNTTGAVDVLTPDGQHMTSDIAALAYFDGTTNAVIATLQDSIGQVLSSGNQVLYTNAFTNASADVLYTQTQSSLEQNVIIRAQLPSPGSLGLNGSSIWLQVWSEFTAAPSPAISTDPVTGGENFDFGVMKMGRGTAFLIGSASNSVPVTKEWVTSSGRSFLIESVPLSAIQDQLDQLPGGGESKLHVRQPRLASATRQTGPPHQTLNKIKLPERKLAKKSSATMRVAKTAEIPNGLVLDYITVNGSLTNQTFQSDTTYYVSGNTELYDTTTLEGGTVIKNGSPINNDFTVNGTFVCTATNYRPVIFTCTNDDTVGAPLDGGGGTPSVSQGTTYLYFPNGGPPISNIHFRYGWNSFVSLGGDVEVSDCQFIDCMNPVTVIGSTNVGLHNILLQLEDVIDNTNNYVHGIPGGILFNTSTSANLYCEHLTASTGTNNYMSFVLGTDTNAAVALTNSIVIAPSLNPPYKGGAATSVTATTNHVFYTVLATSS